MTRRLPDLPLHAWHSAWGPRPGQPAPAARATQATPVQTRDVGRSTVSGAGR